MSSNLLSTMYCASRWVSLLTCSWILLLVTVEGNHTHSGHLRDVGFYYFTMVTGVVAILGTFPFLNSDFKRKTVFEVFGYGSQYLIVSVLCMLAVSVLVTWICFAWVSGFLGAIPNYYGVMLTGMVSLTVFSYLVRAVYTFVMYAQEVMELTAVEAARILEKRRGAT